MDFMRILGICAFVVCLTQCRKKSNPVESEVREAGYEMSLDGWFNAVRNNDTAVLGKMVEGGFDPKTTGPEGKSGLHVAAASGSADAGEYLLNRGLSVDAKESGGKTPLMEAVLADRSEMVNWLLRQGADPKLKDNDGFMALMLAATEGKAASVEELAPYHRDDLDSAFLLAALVGKAEVIDVLTNYGASVYARMEDGRTTLMLAAQNGHREAAALLIDIGASRFSTTEGGDTAKSLAVSAGHYEIAELIESGFTGDNLAFETDEEVAVAMGEYREEVESTPEDDGALASLGSSDGDKKPNPSGGALPEGGEEPSLGSQSAQVGSDLAYRRESGSGNDSTAQTDDDRLGASAGGIAQATGGPVQRAGDPLASPPRTLAGARVGGNEVSSG